MKLLHSFAFTLLTLSSLSSFAASHKSRKPATADVKVGVLGDSHGQANAVKTALHRMQIEGVTQLIVLGDIVPWNLKEIEGLRPILDMIRTESGLPKEAIHFVIGNAEEDVLAEWTPRIAKMKLDGVTEESLWTEVDARRLDYDDMRAQYFDQKPFEQTKSYKLFKEYGELQHPGPDAYAFLDAGGKRIAYSHYNKRPVPESMLQPTDALVTREDPETGKMVTRKVNFRRPHTVDPARIKQPFPKGADIAFYGDIHIGGFYWDLDAEKVIVNAGVLHAASKEPTEPQAYTIYNASHDELSFWDAKSDRMIHKSNLRVLESQAKSSCSALFLKLATLANP